VGAMGRCAVSSAWIGAQAERPRVWSQGPSAPAIALGSAMGCMRTACCGARRPCPSRVSKPSLVSERAAKEGQSSVLAAAEGAGQGRRGGSPFLFL